MSSDAIDATTSEEGGTAAEDEGANTSDQEDASSDGGDGTTTGDGESGEESDESDESDEETADDGEGGSDEEGGDEGAEPADVEPEDCGEDWIAGDFAQAPPPRAFGEAIAVAIDITQSEGRIRFDVAQSSATGSATVEFRMGQYAGFPALDLRQRITSLTLDGEALDPEEDLSRQVLSDEGPGHEMLVIRRALEACGTHVLTFEYEVSAPLSKNATKRTKPPEYGGDAVRWIDDLNDLAPGNFLEAWFPANLLFDRHDFRMHVEVDGTDRPHRLVSSGVVQLLEENRWSVTFGERFTAHSPMWGLFPADELLSSSVSVELADETNIELELHKLASLESLDLQPISTFITQRLQELSVDIGPYLHGERFVTLLLADSGGSAMEYDGGTASYTTQESTLYHEVFHNWWARGVQPLTQDDGWLDEGWTTASTYGGSWFTPSVLDFDTHSPQASALGDPWSRAPRAEIDYNHWASVFLTLGHQLGAEELEQAMVDYWFHCHENDFYMSTVDLERFLYCRSEDDGVRQIFHRWVWGAEGEAEAPPADYCSNE